MIEPTRRQLCYLDTNVFIDTFEKPEEETAQLRMLFEAFRRNPQLAVTSELTLAELLAPTGSMFPPALRNRLYIDLLIWGGFIDLRPVTREVLLGTSDLRRTISRKMKLPDAIHVMTAIKAGCSIMVSSDGDLGVLPSGLIAIRPDAAGIATVMDALRA